MTTKIYLVGDAILDNFYWLKDKNQDLRKELSDLGHVVNNYAVDNTKVINITNGIAPKDIYVNSRPYPYPTNKDGNLVPMELISKDTGISSHFMSYYNTNKNDIVVLSMGGNDIYSNISKILLGAEGFVNSILTENFVKDYEHVIYSILNKCSKIILISVYLPYLGVGSAYGLYSPMSKPIIEKWNKFIFSVGKKFKIPILDLSRTLNVGNREHYGTDDTRVSNLTNKCIAKCIDHISKNYTPGIYYSPDFIDVKYDKYS
jgi:hypothetical protein